MLFYRMAATVCTLSIAGGLTLRCEASLVKPFKSKWTGNILEVSTSTPPAALLVIGADGKRVGAHPDFPISNVGLGTEINEFLIAEVEQQNITNDDPNEPPGPSPTTGWYVRIQDEIPHTYLVQIRGINTKNTSVRAWLDISNVPSPIPTIRRELFVANGSIKEFMITTNSDMHEITMERQVRPGELAASIDIACDLKLLEPDGICQSLKAKADAAAAAMKRGNKKAAKGVLNAFLNELKAQRDKHVKEPALTILREEAEALLKGLDGGRKRK